MLARGLRRARARACRSPRRRRRSATTSARPARSRRWRRCSASPQGVVHPTPAARATDRRSGARRRPRPRRAAPAARSAIRPVDQPRVRRRQRGDRLRTRRILRDVGTHRARRHGRARSRSPERARRVGGGPDYRPRSRRSVRNRPRGVSRRPTSREPSSSRSTAPPAFHRGRRRALRAPRSGDDLAPLLPAGAGRRMSPPARFAVAAARLALADAGLAGPTSTTRAPGSSSAPRSARPGSPSSCSARSSRQGPEAASPALFTESVANASAAQVALALERARPERDAHPARGERPGGARRRAALDPQRPRRPRRSSAWSKRCADPARGARPIRRAGAAP